MTRRLTALIQREGDGYVALCPELDIASQGDSIEQARENLREALELFFEVASAKEIDRRFSDDVFVTQVEVAVGQVASHVWARGVRDPRTTRIRRGPSAVQPHRDATARNDGHDDGACPRPPGTEDRHVEIDSSSIRRATGGV